MSLLCRNGFSAPIDAMMLFEFGCTGHFLMSWFHGLSCGKTCNAAIILSACGVSKGTGLVISGIVGRSLASVAASREFEGSLPREFEIVIQEIADNSANGNNSRVMIIWGGLLCKLLCIFCARNGNPERLATFTVRHVAGQQCLVLRGIHGDRPRSR